MTIKEVQLVIEAFSFNKQNEIQSKKNEIYNNAYLIAAFVGRALGGKKIPTIEEIYPEDYKQDEKMSEKQIEVIKQQFIKFAEEANKRRK